MCLPLPPQYWGYMPIPPSTALDAPSITWSGYRGGDIDVYVCVHTGFIYKETRVVMYTYIPSFSRNWG